MTSILVLDSGVGGLSVCESILAKMPDVQLIYFADDAYFPYGLLDEPVLRARLDVVVSSMLAYHKPDLVVLACNTVSTLVLPELREKFDLPFVGVVPAIKPAAENSKSKCIALIATPATVKRSYTDDLVASFANDCHVTRIGSSDLVVEAERFLAGHPVDRAKLREILQPLKSDCEGKQVDTLVLGCTHFPLIREHIQAELPDVSLVDSGEAIARRVEHLLDACSSSGDRSGGGCTYDDRKEENPTEELVHQIYFSELTPNEDVLSHSLQRLGISRYQLHCFSAMMD